jgi:hypothetical protein
MGIQKITDGGSCDVRFLRYPSVGHLVIKAAYDIEFMENLR